MAKPLATILKKYSDVIAGKLPASEINALTLGKEPGVDYAPKMADEREFVASHSVEKHPDRNGNGDDVFKGARVKQAVDDRHGHIPNPKSKNQYTQANEETDLDEKYQGFDKTERSLAAKGAENPKALAAWIGRKKYGKEKFQKAAAEGKKLKEAKDDREYDYEGEMAVTKLKTICRHAEHLIDMMKPNTNLPEWVQSKIVKAEDYISTAHDYLMSEMNEEVEQIDEVTASINHKYVPEKWGEKSGKVKKIIDSLEKAKIPHSVAHLGGDRNSGITYVTSDHPKFASHMEKLAKKANTYDPKIYVHGVNEEIELDETKKPEVSISDNVAHVKNSQGKVVASYSKKIHGSDFVKRANAHMAKLNEAKCNMTEAGKMCEVHGMKACPKNKAADDQPMMTKDGKKKLLLEPQVNEEATSQAQQKLMAMAYRYKQNPDSMPDASAQVKELAKTMTIKQLHDFAKTKRSELPKKVQKESATSQIKMPSNPSNETADYNSGYNLGRWTT